MSRQQVTPQSYRRWQAERIAAAYARIYGLKK